MKQFYMPCLTARQILHLETGDGFEILAPAQPFLSQLPCHHLTLEIFKWQTCNKVFGRGGCSRHLGLSWDMSEDSWSGPNGGDSRRCRSDFWIDRSTKILFLAFPETISHFSLLSPISLTWLEIRKRRTRIPRRILWNQTKAHRPAISERLNNGKLFSTPHPYNILSIFAIFGHYL